MIDTINKGLNRVTVLLAQAVLKQLGIHVDPVADGRFRVHWPRQKTVVGRDDLIDIATAIAGPVQPKGPATIQAVQLSRRPA